MDINYDAITRLARKRHPLAPTQSCDCHHWCGEMREEAHAMHNMLDLFPVPHGTGSDSDLHVRLWQAMVIHQEFEERLARIARWHARETADMGMVGLDCVECAQTWPCDTYRMANGTYKDPEQ